MRTGLLSPKEKQIIETFLTDGVKLDGFSVLVHRCRKHRSDIESDLATIKKILDKVGPK